MKFCIRLNFHEQSDETDDQTVTNSGLLPENFGYDEVSRVIKYISNISLLYKDEMVYDVHHDHEDVSGWS